MLTVFLLPTIAGSDPGCCPRPGNECPPIESRCSKARLIAETKCELREGRKQLERLKGRNSGIPRKSPAQIDSICSGEGRKVYRRCIRDGGDA